MNKKLMNIYDASVVAHNLKCIEDALGYPAPAGTVDYESISDRLMNFVEVEIMAENIRSIMDAKRGRVVYDTNKRVGFLGILFGMLIAAPILYGILGLAYAVFSTLFMFL